MPFVEAKRLERRRIGNKDVFPIGFGLMGLSVGYGDVGTDEERLKVSFTCVRARESLTHCMSL